MEEMFSLNNDILNAVQSLQPVEKLEELRVKAEDNLKLASGLTKDTDNGQWTAGDLIGDPKLREEINKEIIMIDGLLKFFNNRDNDGCKNFNKFLLFSNIRELLKASDIKIGQIEKEAGLQNGYMSRLEKLDNSTDPSVEFLLTASKLLKVSIDSLTGCNFRSLNETELYLLKVIDKFRTDTMNNKLEWQIESAEMLNDGTYSADWNAHPLFNESLLHFETGCDYPEDRSLYTFNSYSYGAATEIADDCYNVKIKNYSTIYIMNIKRLITNKNDIEDYTKEVWLVDRNNNKECLVSINKFPGLADAVNDLYQEIKAYASRPKLSKDTRKILDGYLNDDFSIDEEEFAF